MIPEFIETCKTNGCDETDNLGNDDLCPMCRKFFAPSNLVKG